MKIQFKKLCFLSLSPMILMLSAQHSHSFGGTGDDFDDDGMYVGTAPVATVPVSGTGTGTGGTYAHGIGGTYAHGVGGTYAHGVGGAYAGGYGTVMSVPSAKSSVIEAELGYQHITAPFNSSSNTTTDNVTKDFVSRTRMINYNNNEANLEQVLQAVSEAGPMSVRTKQGSLEKRVWLTPMINKSAVSSRDGAAGTNGFSGGFLAGAELRGGKSLKWVTGLMTGYVSSKNTSKVNKDDNLKNNGVFAGIYNRLDYSPNWQHEVVASRLFLDNKLSRYDVDVAKIASAKYKSTQDTFNFQVNYLGNVIPDTLTYRIDVGTTYTGTNKKGYTETGTDAANNQIVSKSSSTAVDMYAGLGLRHTFNTFDGGQKVTTIRTTGVYEYAAEVHKKAKNAEKFTALDRTATSDPATGKIRNKHIFQLNTSFLNRNVGVKFILGYEGVFYRNDQKARVQNHTGTLKMEYKW